jgi:hypothetical protein
MTITIGTFSTSYMTAQPFAYEGEARTGLTARTFRVSGMLTPAQWQALVTEYNTWRDTRITDADTLQSGTVGTTVSLTVTSANGLSVSGLACWFAEAPSGEQLGTYVNASALLVDANQALAVLLRGQEKSRQGSEALRPSFGTLTLGSCTITLTKPPETYQDLPGVALGAGGTSYITGPLSATKVKNVEGTTTSAGWTALQTWFDTTVAASPTVGQWFPISAPTASAEVIISGGAKTTQYTVSLSLAQIQ